MSRPHLSEHVHTCQRTSRPHLSEHVHVHTCQRTSRLHLSTHVPSTLVRARPHLSEHVYSCQRTSRRNLSTRYLHYFQLLVCHLQFLSPSLFFWTRHSTDFIFPSSLSLLITGWSPLFSFDWSSPRVLTEPPTKGNSLTRSTTGGDADRQRSCRKPRDTPPSDVTTWLGDRYERCHHRAG